MGCRELIYIVTDLDGCLLDPSTYDYREAIPVISEALSRGVELVFNSSKSRVEQEYFREKWGLRNIFVAENGAAIYIPVEHGYNTVVNGVPRERIERDLRDLIERSSDKLLWLRDMDPFKFSQITNYPPEVSRLALIREYSTLFHPLVQDKVYIRRIIYEIERRGYIAQTGSGRIYLVTGRHDKGVATRQLRSRLDGLFVGIGDGFNDLPMLVETDYSIVLGNRDLYDRLLSVKQKDKTVYIDDRGPKAWLQGVTRILRIIS